MMLTFRMALSLRLGHSTWAFMARMDRENQNKDQISRQSKSLLMSNKSSSPWPLCSLPSIIHEPSHCPGQLLCVITLNIRVSSSWRSPDSFSLLYLTSTSGSQRA
ncbi:hypothetical protein B0T13DRAFT_62810 [Neurospora crassa]|nr:hypothetical protein B0T13DRAFT_62810 [Neurospora crassa]